jgi:hypothetical protein
MPRNNTQFESLRSRVAKLEGAAGASSKTTEKSAWLTVGVPIIAVVLAALAWLQPQYSTSKNTDFNNSVDGRIDLKLKEPNEKLTKIGTDIAAIDGTLKAWAPFMTPLFFKKSIALPEKDFAQSLPQLKAAAQVGSESRTPIPADNLADAGKRTLALASANSDLGKLAWETTSALLQYRSWVRY